MDTRWLGPGLFLATLSTLLLETLDARLLSVLTWYHLSFFAVSLAMLGMAAGAVFVFLRPETFSPDQAPTALARFALAYAVSVPSSHLFTLVMPLLPLTDVSLMEILSITVFTVVRCPSRCPYDGLSVAHNPMSGSILIVGGYTYEVGGVELDGHGTKIGAEQEVTLLGSTGQAKGAYPRVASNTLAKT